jgi:hypothetical protein
MRCCLAVPRSNDCQTVADTRRVVGSCWLCGAHRARAPAVALRGCGRKLSCIGMRGCGRKRKGVDENLWQSRQDSDSCIGACQQRIDAVCRADSASAVPSAQLPKSDCEHAAWLLASKTRSLQTFLAITLASRAAPSIADCVDRTELMQGISWLCGLHCWACLGLDCHDFRMPMQVHALCVLHTASSFPPLDSCRQLSDSRCSAALRGSTR